MTIISEQPISVNEGYSVYPIRIDDEKFVFIIRYDPIPIDIEFVKVRDFGNKKRYTRGFRRITTGCCAETFIDNDDDDYTQQLTFWYPRPQYCPYDDFTAMLMLINHEIMHAVFEDFDTDEGDIANNCWDKIAVKMNKTFPDIYCDCASSKPNQKGKGNLKAIRETSQGTGTKTGDYLR